MIMSKEEYERDQRQQYAQDAAASIAAKEHQLLIDAMHEKIDNILEGDSSLTFYGLLDELTFYFLSREINACFDEIHDIYEQKKEEMAQE